MNRTAPEILFVKHAIVYSGAERMIEKGSV